MPQNKFAIARYAVINELLTKNGYVKSAFIADSCRDSLGYRVSQRTIQLDIHAMKNDSFLGYYAPINYCSQRKAYFYEDMSFQIAFQKLNADEMGTLEYAFKIAQIHMDPEENIILDNVLSKIKKTYIAK